MHTRHTYSELAGMGDKKGDAQAELPFVHLKCRLGFLTMPMGNRLPVSRLVQQLPTSSADDVRREAVAAAEEMTQEGCGGGGDAILGAEAPPASLPSDKFVDAHTIKGISIEKAIEEIAKASPESMEMGELMLRRQIATSVLITMGRKITHFEGEIDMKTGCVDVDFKFTPHINNEQHLASTLGKYDPENDPEQRLKCCAVMRVYTHSFDAKTGDKFSHLLGCSAIDLTKLMEMSHNVTASEGLYCFSSPAAETKGTLSEPLGGTILAQEMRDYDIPLRTNFCNTFVLCTVAPFGGKVHTWGAGEYDACSSDIGSKAAPEIHAGLRVVVGSTVEEFRKGMKPQLDAIKVS